MASQAHNRPGFWPLDEDNAPIAYFPIAASQTLAKGDGVLLSSGLLSILLADSAAFCGVVAQDCSGLAEGTMVPVWGAANPHQIFVARMDGASNAVVAGTLVDSIGASSVMELDASASAVDHWVAISALPDDVTTSADARWMVTINPAVHQLHL